MTGFTINQLSIVGLRDRAGAAGGRLASSWWRTSAASCARVTPGARRRSLATKQIAVAVVGCTATLIFAFLPLIFLPGTAGKFIRAMPLTVVFTVVASLIVSLTIIPWLASRTLSRTEDPEGNVFMRALHRHDRRHLRARAAPRAGPAGADAGGRGGAVRRRRWRWCPSSASASFPRRARRSSWWTWRRRTAAAWPRRTARPASPSACWAQQRGRGGGDDQRGARQPAGVLQRHPPQREPVRGAAVRDAGRVRSHGTRRRCSTGCGRGSRRIPTPASRCASSRTGRPSTRPSPSASRGRTWTRCASLAAQVERVHPRHAGDHVRGQPRAAGADGPARWRSTSTRRGCSASRPWRWTAPSAWGSRG